MTRITERIVDEICLLRLAILLVRALVTLRIREMLHRTPHRLVG